MCLLQWRWKDIYLGVYLIYASAITLVKIGKCPIHSIYVRDFCTDVRHVIKDLAPYVMHVFNIVTRMVITANTDIFGRILKFRERGFYLHETKFRENKTLVYFAKRDITPPFTDVG